jgi:perosamine synthetase
MQRIPVAGPWITEKEIQYVTEAVTTAWYEAAGEPVSRFETAFSQYVDRQVAIALPSCTAGLHLVLAALGVGAGDEVIVPDLTWIATSAPISYVGATAVFADVDPQSLCLTNSSVEACLTSRTKAVIAVDLYGAMPDMAGLQELADQHGIWLIEDAAEAIGSSFAGRKAGGFGCASVFSFHGSKTMTTGEGGMLVTDDVLLRDRIDVLRDHGRRPGDRAFNNSEVAFKYKMTSLQAALGLAQLERIEELLTRKREIYSWYSERMTGVPGLTLSTSSMPDEVVWWMVTAQVDPALGWDKDSLQEALSTAGIDSRPLFRPLSSLPAYVNTDEARAAKKRNRVAYASSPYGLNLPSALSLTEADVDRVCHELTHLVTQAR